MVFNGQEVLNYARVPELRMAYNVLDEILKILLLLGNILWTRLRL